MRPNPCWLRLAVVAALLLLARGLAKGVPYAILLCATAAYVLVSPLDLLCRWGRANRKEVAEAVADGLPFVLILLAVFQLK